MGRWVQITGVLKKDAFDQRTLAKRLWDYACWIWFSAVRAVKNPRKWYKRRQRVRQINKYLLNEAKELKNGNR
jgi:hypothetical protein